MDYFDRLEADTKALYEIANEARSKGLDVETKSEVPLAKDLAERVEGLVGPEGVAKRIKELEQYSAYHKKRLCITLSEKFAGLGQAGSDYAFRGVVVGKDYNGNKMVIENPSDKPFVSVSNGCVVKDLDIKVTAKTITLTNDKNGTTVNLRNC